MATTGQQPIPGIPPQNTGMVAMPQAQQTPASAAAAAPPVGMIGASPAAATTTGQTKDWEITPDQLVEHRLKGLMSDNNPLNQQAQTQGLQSAQERGLLNSSMGVQAGQAALYQHALPIATADSNTVASAAEANANNANQREITAMNNATSRDVAGISAGATIAAANISAQNRVDLENLGFEHNAILNSSRYANEAFQNSIGQLTRIAQDPNMSAEAKQAASDQIVQATQTQIYVTSAIAGVDTGDLLNFG